MATVRIATADDEPRIIDTIVIAFKAISGSLNELKWVKVPWFLAWGRG